MARIRTEDQIFFIFNHQALVCEEDDLKDAIVYFFPTSISTDGQCALVGQLMGLVDFFKSFSTSPPLIYKLQKNKVAIKHLGKYTMALSGNRTEPDCVVITQLNYLYNIFVFYFGSLQQLDENYKGNTTSMSSIMHNIWDCYLPFVRRYGDNVAAAFDSLPVLDLPEPHSVTFLKASHLLQDCQMVKNAIAGCILYKNRVLCSQLHPDITARLLIIQSSESHFPCQPIKTDACQLEGAKLVMVFVSKKEYQVMKHIQMDNSSSARGFNQSQQSEKKREISTPSISDAEKMSKQLSHGHCLGSVDRENEVKQFKPEAIDRRCEKAGMKDELPRAKNNIEPELCKKKVSERINGDNETFYCGPLSHKSLSQPDVSEGRNGVQNQTSRVCGAPSYGRQKSCEFRSSNVVGIEHQNADCKDPKCEKDWAVVGEHLCSENETNSNLDDEVDNIKKTFHLADSEREYSKKTELQHEQSSEGSVVHVCQGAEPFYSSAALLRNVKRITAHSEKKLESIVQKANLNNDIISIESDQDETSPSINKLTSLKDMSQMYGDVKPPKCSGILEQDISNMQCEGDSLSAVQTKDAILNSRDISAGSENEESKQRIHAVIHDTNGGVLSSGLSHDIETATVDLTSLGDHVIPQDPDDCITEESDLLALTLYIQEASDTTLFLFMENDTQMDEAIINDMLRMVTAHLVDLEGHLSELSGHTNLMGEKTLDYNYLMYNRYTKNLSGQISMSHGILQPLSHEELDFCGTAIAMHDEFEKTPDLVDMTMRNHTSCVYGHRAFSQEVYFHPKHCKPPRGISPARKTVMCLNDVARQALLTDRGINII